MGGLRACWIVVSALMLAACAAGALDPEERLRRAEEIAAGSHLTRGTFETGTFLLTGFVKPGKGDVLSVYIEGDGFAWVTRHRPSRDPTPIDPVALRLAVADGGNVAYIARPCQYSRVVSPGCDARYWTSERFAPAVIDALNVALNQVKLQSGANALVLVGYSGGGAVAALLAAQRSDVVHLITVAGNLDHAVWSRLHGLSPLEGSLNPPDFWPGLEGIPQTHFVGALDQTVPITVYRAYRSRFREEADIQVRIVDAADHRCCWAREWPHLLETISNRGVW